MTFDLNKLQPISLLAIAFCALFIIPLGAIFIFVYNPTLFLKMEIEKLLLLASAFSMPLLIINYFISVLILSPDNPDIKDRITKDVFQTSVISSCIITAVPIGLSTLLGYYFNIHTKFGIGIMLLIQLLIIIVSTIIICNERPLKRA